MPAHNEHFPWRSYYGHYKFFEKLIAQHSRVTEVIHVSDGIYEIKLRSGKKLRLFVCECYSFGVAEFQESIDQLTDLDAIVINSAWCGYTPDAKLHCRNSEVGLFKISDFMAALNTEKFWLYLNADEEEMFEQRGWI